MKSTKDKVLVASIVLNIALAAGTMWSLKFMGTRSHEVMASAIIGNTNNMRWVIEELDSGDLSRIEAMKKRLHKLIVEGEKAGQMWKTDATQP